MWQAALCYLRWVYNVCSGLSVPIFRMLMVLGVYNQQNHGGHLTSAEWEIWLPKFFTPCVRKTVKQLENCGNFIPQANYAPFKTLEDWYYTLNILGRFSTVFYKGDNILFAFLHTMSLLKGAYSKRKKKINTLHAG